MRNFYASGLTDDWDYSEVEEFDRLNIESILKNLYEDKLLKESVSKLRDYPDDTWIGEELRKDLKSAIALDSEQFERLISIILEKGFINAIFEESKISLNKSSVLECLEKIEPLVQVKPIKRKGLYLKNFEIWKNKIDDLVKNVLSHNLNNKDSETLIKIQEIVKIEKLEI